MSNRQMTLQLSASTQHPNATQTRKTRCCYAQFQQGHKHCIESIKSVETGIVTGRELLLAQESLAPALVRPRDSRPGYQVECRPGLRHPTARKVLGRTGLVNAALALRPLQAVSFRARKTGMRIWVWVWADERTKMLLLSSAGPAKMADKVCESRGMGELWRGIKLWSGGTR